MRGGAQSGDKHRAVRAGVVDEARAGARVTQGRARDRRCDRSGNELDESHMFALYIGFVVYNTQKLHFYVCASTIFITRAR